MYDKIGHHKKGFKYVNIRIIVSKWVPQWTKIVARIWSKMVTKSDVDPKMAPKDARGPQDGPPRPNMTPELFKNDPK